VCVRELVYERADLPVGGSGGDDDLPALGVAPAAGPFVGQLTDLDAVAELAAELLQRCDQVAVAVALDRLCGRRERHRLLPGQRFGHRDVEDRHGAEEDALLARLLAGVVALFDGDRGKDPDRLLALTDAAVEGEEGAEAGDVGRRDPAGVAVDRDQPLVAQAVTREAVGRAHADPAPPPLGGEQGARGLLARGLLDALSVSLAMRGALLFADRVAVEATSHRQSLSFGWPAPGARADPPPPARPSGRATLSWRVGPRKAGPATRRRRDPRDDTPAPGSTRQ
jgi:hypothetical protein